MSAEEILRMFLLFLLAPMGGAIWAMFMAKFIITEPLRRFAARVHWSLRYLLECVVCIYGWPAFFIMIFYEPKFLRWLLNVKWEMYGVDILWLFDKALSFGILWYLGGFWYKHLYPFIEKNAPKKRLPFGQKPLRKRKVLHPESYDIGIIGGGVTGTAQAYIFSQFMKGVEKILFLEKNKDVALVNSNTASNAQTAHGGDTETNFSFEKALKMRDAEHFLASFLEKLGLGAFRVVYKMAYGVGEEVKILIERFRMLGFHYPTLRLIGREELWHIERKLIEGRDPNIPVAALYRPNGYSVDYHKLAKCFEREFGTSGKVTPWLKTKTRRIVKKDGFFEIRTNNGIFQAKMVLVAAGPYSLLFAHDLGYATDYTILPVAGSFYRTRAVVLKGKVYPVQDPDLPFARLHMDPDVNNPGEMRFGPTIDFIPLLERNHWRTFLDFFRTGLVSFRGQRSVLKILRKKKIARLVVKNLIYKIPLLGKYFVLRAARNIVPTLNYRDIWYAKGEGGIRPQIIDLKTGELVTGTGKIKGENIIFDITPSPGASDCIRNALINAKLIEESSRRKYEFDATKFLEEFPETKEAISRLMETAL